MSNLTGLGKNGLHKIGERAALIYFIISTTQSDGSVWAIDIYTH